MQRFGECFVVAMAVSAVALLVGCGGKDAGDPAAPAPVVAEPAPSSEADEKPAAEPAEPAPAGVVLQGTIIKKPWSKSGESWNAGGSEYYVLDVGGAEVEHKSAKEGVTLIATEAVPMSTFDAKVGQQVSVRGEYVEAKPYTPKSQMEQYPTGMDGKPLPRGAGFRVLALE